MNLKLHQDADEIIHFAIDEVKPDSAVKRALEGAKLSGNIYMVAVGKAGWQMAAAAQEVLDGRLKSGIVVTKYGHVKGTIPHCECLEAGHPIPDDNSLKGTEKIIQMVEGLNKDDTVCFLLSGGGSALFEKPLVSLEEIQNITEQLLACGAGIVEINTIRKRLSGVKGGRFAQLCAPAKVYTIVLSDIVGDPLDMIASGPAYPDSSTSEDAIAIVNKYHISMSEQALKLMKRETPKTLDNVTTVITGSVRELCRAAERKCLDLGYETVLLTDCLTSQAKDAGDFFASIAKTHSEDHRKTAYIAGGETVVKLTGHGKGGRNQELALSAAEKISGLKNVAIFSVGSDGTDGPTDAAGGYVDGDSFSELQNLGIDVNNILANNDSYNALGRIKGLIFTGPTGTNVNDLAVVLVDRR